MAVDVDWAVVLLAPWRPGGVAVAVSPEPLPAIPAEVRVPECLLGFVVHFLEALLPDVADRDPPRRRVEAEAERVAKAAGEDGVLALPALERVALGDRVGPRAGRVEGIDPQELAEQASLVLGVLARVASAAAVARPHVEVAVRAEDELAAVVVRGEAMTDA